MIEIRGQRSESGQVFIILILVMVVLMGFMALAIDVGMLYSERRRAQNAADAGALAAALAMIKSQNLHVAALERADSNGFATTSGPCDPQGYDCTLGTGSKWTVQVSSPPRSGEYSGYSEYIQLTITSEVDTSFAHLIFKGPLRTTVEAVSRARLSGNIAPGYAIYSTSEHDCKGIWFSGTGDTVINGGSIFSNSDAGSAGCQSGVQDGSGTVTVGPSPESIEVVGSFDAGGSGSVTPAPVEGVAQGYLRPVPLPDCSGLLDYGNKTVPPAGSTTLLPGRYESISILPGATATMSPGMYCIYGANGFAGLGGSINGTGVMIYLQAGDFDLGGTTLVALAAEQAAGVLLDASQNDWRGMLVYVDPSNSGTVSLTGNTGTTYTGAIYAPGSQCTINGTGDSIGLLNSQLICDKVKITGTAQVTFDLSENDTYALPSAIDLAK
jgi:hypothetical protein